MLVIGEDKSNLFSQPLKVIFQDAREVYNTLVEKNGLKTKVREGDQPLRLSTSLGLPRVCAQDGLLGEALQNSKGRRHTTGRIE